MEDLFKRIDISVLYPPFAAKLQQLMDACEARGVRYYAISGYRSVEEQDGLYAQGRTKPGAIVTKAKGGQSAHNFSVATDFCRDGDITRAGLQPEWDAASYEVLAEEAVKLDLEPGFYWKFKDCPHVQLPLGKHGITMAQLLAEYHQGGLVQVQAFLDQYQW